MNSYRLTALNVRLLPCAITVTILSASISSSPLNVFSLLAATVPPLASCIKDLINPFVKIILESFLPSYQPIILSSYFPTLQNGHKCLYDSDVVAVLAQRVSVFVGCGVISCRAAVDQIDVPFVGKVEDSSHIVGM